MRPPERNSVSRRRLLGWGVAALGATMAPTSALAHANRAARHIAFRHLHTGETLTVTYWADGAYVLQALGEVDRLLRDFRTDEVRRIDPSLLDLLHRLRAATGASQPFEVISGYRSPTTNAMLRANGHGVAPKSLHMSGMAIDVRLPGRRLRDLRKAALGLRLGGVGYYPQADFVHLDVGRVRSW